MMAMIDLLLLVLASLSALLGCAFLALSQHRHWRTVMGKGAPHRAVRPAGWALLAISLAICISRDGSSFAVILWPLLLSAAAILVVMIIAYWPKTL
ncbi:MAG: DUF3325 domain-containing protein [Pseudomonadota bacterium]